MPFNQVSAEHAYKEGEGDKSLLYWRKGHKEWFKNELESIIQGYTDIRWAIKR